VTKASTIDNRPTDDCFAIVKLPIRPFELAIDDLKITKQSLNH